jgi:predicted ATPase
MAIKHITVSNFKSFKEVDIELGKFNVLIGANASGKSNFVSVFQFLRDIVASGLKDAISLQGGVDYFTNTRIGPSEPFSVRIVSDSSFEFALYEQNRREKLLYIEATEVTYEFAIHFRQNSSEFDITKDELTVTCDFSERNIIELREIKKLGDGTFRISNHHGISNHNGELEYEVNSSNPVVKAYNQFLTTPKMWLAPKVLLLEMGWVVALPPNGSFGSYLDDIATYDFEAKRLKKPISLIGKSELASDGSNLALVLRQILEDKEKKRKLVNLVRDVLPFVEDFSVTRFADNSLITEFREIYSRGSALRALPATFMSDGTVNIVALIIALYFEDNSVAVIEEPERNVHPYLVSKIVGMLREVSEKKQIIVTTQNPEMVRHADLTDMLLISRDSEGFSQISRPAEKAGVRTFLEHEIGIEELYVRNLLGA